MSFPAYPEYKDSGVVWLGEVPSHWDVKRLGFFFWERREKVSDVDYAPLSVTKSGIVPQLETAAKTDDNDNRKKVCSGDFVINSRSDRKGSSGVSAFDGSVSLINTVLVQKEGVFSGYIHHLMRSVDFQEEFYRNGKGIVADLWSTNYSEMRDIVLAIPTLQEQLAIATFLDHETAKTDALIAEQEKLIELLKEKRHAVISHAVTKGLDPNAPMKDSGVEWLGKVPEHWKAVKLRRIVDDVQTGGTPSMSSLSPEEGETIDWYTPADFSSAIQLESASKKLSIEAIKNDKVKIFPKGAILVVGIGATLGKTGYLMYPASANQQINAILPSTEISGLFLTYSLASKIVEMRYLSNSSTIGIMNQEKTKEIWIALPPRWEQESITRYLEEDGVAVDALLAEAQKAITLLKERRSALISAAVTGKIDVRGYAPQQEAV